jgi:hypothetical protein
MKLKDLTREKNRILCQMEDYILDALLANIDGLQGDEKARAKASSALAKEVSSAVKKNALEIAIICYEGDNGETLTEASFENVPMKLKVFNECLSPIMEIVSDFMSGSVEAEAGTSEGKRIAPERS